MRGKWLRGKTAVKENIFRRDCCFFSSFQKRKHGRCSFFRGQFSAFVTNASFVHFCILLIWIIFIKRYTVSFAKAGVFRPVIRFIYMLLLEKIGIDTGFSISIPIIFLCSVLLYCHGIDTILMFSTLFP